MRAVDGVSFELERGKVLGIVGESGSGKSVTAMTVMGLTRDINARFGGEVNYQGRNLLELSDAEMQNYRGNEIGMIFQDPMTSLNPVYRIGEQIVEAIQTHEKIDKRGAQRRAVELLRQVGIPNPESRVDDFPHQFSGGMRQRAMIAMALSCNPSILIADEPTTALDVTIQAQIIELIAQLKDDFNSAVIMITHDLGVVADIADEIIVMYAGRVVERAATRDLFYDPQMPYTWGLLGSIPRLDRPRPERLHSIKGAPPSVINMPPGCKFRPRCPHAFEKCMEEPALENRVETPGHLDRCWLDVDVKRLGARRDDRRRGAGGRMSTNGSGAPLIEVKHVKKYFPIRKGLLQREVARVHAVDDVSFAVREGETLGLVGESGCGKSTLGRTIVRLLEPTARRDPLRRAADREARRAPAAPAAAADADGLPGSVRVAEPAQAGRLDHRRPAQDPRARRQAGAEGTGRGSCSRRSVSRRSTTTGSRTSSRAASGSGSGSRGRSRYGRSWSSRTSRSRRSTSRSSRRC